MRCAFAALLGMAALSSSIQETRAASQVPDISGIWIGIGPGRPDIDTRWRNKPFSPAPELTRWGAEESRNLGRLGTETGTPGACNPVHPVQFMSAAGLFPLQILRGSNQILMLNELVGVPRRIYTDGRGHPPESDRYPLYNGDSIGFWDGDHLVIHTNQLQAGIYQRAHPDYTEQVETVEIWHKGDPTTLLADVWVYDPPALAEPWYVQQAYKKVDEQGGNLRIRYWNCGENQNNSVYQTKDGTTQFHDFTFDGARGAQPRGERK